VTWQLSLSGALVGVLVGAVGMGGGSLLTPLLVVAFGFNPVVAVGTDLFHGAVFKTVGALRHQRLGTVEARLSGWMLAASAPASLLGVAAATWLRHRTGTGEAQLEGAVVGGALLLGGLGLAAKAFSRFREEPVGPFVMTRRDRVAALLVGAGGGFVVGLTSVGSGVFFGLTMLVVFRLGSRKVVGTDVLHAAALLWVAGAGHLVAGNVDIRAVGWLLVGSIPGVLVGAEISVRMPPRNLRLMMALTLLASGVKLIAFPAATEVALALLCLTPVALVFGRRRATPEPEAVVTPP
jgi:uncharacterized membrane protein YfcA